MPADAAEIVSLGDLSDAIALATQAHRGQVDKGGQPYILHPLRVMLACQTEEQRVVAVLHDVVEDTGYTVSDIASEFGAKVANAIDALTRRRGEDYEAFIDRCAANPLSAFVKLADIGDNMDVSRLGREPNAADRTRLLKYGRARTLLVRARAAQHDHEVG